MRLAIGILTFILCTNICAVDIEITQKLNSELKMAKQMLNENLSTIDKSIQYETDSYISNLRELRDTFYSEESLSIKNVQELSDNIRREIRDSYNYNTISGQYIRSTLENYILKIEDVQENLAL